MRLIRRRIGHMSVLNVKRRFIILLMTALLCASGAGACGVQEGQEKVDEARKVEKEMDKRQQEIEEKLQEGQ